MVCFFLVSICFFAFVRFVSLFSALSFAIVRCYLFKISLCYMIQFVHLFYCANFSKCIRTVYLVNLCANCNSSYCLRIIWGPTVEGQEYANWIQQTSKARFGFFSLTRARDFFSTSSSTVQNTIGMSCGTLCFNFPSVNIILMAIWTCFTQIVRSYFHSFLILWI